MCEYAPERPLKAHTQPLRTGFLCFKCWVGAIYASFVAGTEPFMPTIYRIEDAYSSISCVCVCISDAWFASLSISLFLYVCLSIIGAHNRSTASLFGNGRGRNDFCCLVLLRFSWDCPMWRWAIHRNQIKCYMNSYSVVGLRWFNSMSSEHDSLKNI